MNVKDYMQQAGKAARKASRELARADTAQKNRALLAMADAILREQRSCWPPTPRTWKRRARPAWSRRCWTGWR